MLKLYHSHTSPYVRKVVVLLHETGQIEDVELIPAIGTPVEPNTLPIAQNPLGKVPTLTRPDGAALYDSRTICRFLDERSNESLYPAAPKLWDVLTLESTADGILDAAIAMVYEYRIRPEDKCFEPWVESQWSKIARALDVLEERWIAHLKGPLDMGHIATACALAYLDFRLDPRNWRHGHDSLAAWYENFAQRPSMKATEPPEA